jgi:hypothetical protein
MDYKWYFRRRKWKLSSWVKTKGLKTVESVQGAIGGMGLFNKPDAATVKQALNEAWGEVIEYHKQVDGNKKDVKVTAKSKSKPAAKETGDVVPDLKHYELQDDNFSTKSTVVE